MSRIALTAAIALSICFSGCAACPKPAAFQLTGVDYARVCQHPSMTRAAYRQAFSCQRPALAGSGTPEPRSAWVASADVTGLD